MPPLICLPPQILDQSFPRTDLELGEVADALGDVDELLQSGCAHLVLAGTLSLFVEDFCWGRSNPQGLLQIVYQYLTALLQQPRPDVVQVDVECVASWQPHPVPKGCETEGLVKVWSEEVGKLLVRHDHSPNDGGYYIGVVGTHENAAEGWVDRLGGAPQGRVFPLVSSAQLDDLEDAYVWDVPSGYANRSVRVRDVRTNYKALGAVSLEPPKGDDHYHMVFADGRKWTFSESWSEVGDNAISQLRRLTGMPFAAVKFALIEGKRPVIALSQKLRLDLCAGCRTCPRGCS